MLRGLSTSQSTAIVIVVVWVVAIIYSFWYFSVRHLGSFDNYWATFTGDTLNLKVDIGQILMYYLIDEECPCTRFSLPHTSELRAKHSDVLHKVIRADSSVVDESELAYSIRQIIPASPSVIIFSAEGELTYFGPYSSGPRCGEGVEITSTIIQSLKQGESPHWVNSDNLGFSIIFLHAGYVVVETAVVIFMCVQLNKEAKQSAELMNSISEITQLQGNTSVIFDYPESVSQTMVAK